MRLDKYICECTGMTRSVVKGIIKNKKVAINDKIVTDSGYTITENDSVIYEGQLLSYKKYRYYLLNKPAGYITATTDEKDLTVLDLLKNTNIKDCFPVGRLDKDTEGLLLITNNGELAHKLLTPKKHAPKTYYVELRSTINEVETEMLKAGIDIGEKKPTLPCEIELIDAQSLYITLTEGKYHQIKRMFEKINNKVTYLKRISFGTLRLNDLELGQYRELSNEEVESLYELVK